MKIKTLNPDSKPSFCWDRDLTTSSIRNMVADTTHPQHTSTFAWVLRESPMDELWNFCTPQQVDREFGSLEKHLGRRREMLRYILRTWHELGKL